MDSYFDVTSCFQDGGHDVIAAPSGGRSVRRLPAIARLTRVTSLIRCIPGLLYYSSQSTVHSYVLRIF